MLEVKAGVPKPQRGKGQVLIKAASVGVNPVDVIVRSGYYKPTAFPKVCGLGGSG